MSLPIVDDSQSTLTPTSLAVAVALMYATRYEEPMVAAAIYPGRKRWLWVELPLYVRETFAEVCEYLRLGDQATTDVQRILFR